MHPILFELPWSLGSFGHITVYTYGVLLAAAYLLGLQLARNRAKKRGLDQNRVLDLGIYIIISALVGAKLLLLVTDFRTFPADPRELLTLARPGGGGRAGVPPPQRPAAVDPLRRVRAWDRARPRGRPLRVFVRGLLLREADDQAVGHHVHRSVRRRQRRDTPRGARASAAALRGGRGTDHPDRAAGDRTQRARLRRPDVLAVHAPLRDLALHHRVLPRRRARHRGHVLDLAVHFDPPRAARHRHAGLSLPRRCAGAEARAQGGVRITVPDDSHGVRLDRFLTSVLPDQSRSHIKRLTKDGAARGA